MTRNLSVLAGVVLLASLAACSSEPAVMPTPEVTPTPEATPTVAPTMVVAPFHAIPADAVFVIGTADCSFAMGLEGGDGAGWTYYCQLTTSDPRVSGSERQDGFHFVVQSEQPVGLVWLADNCSIMNAEGSWHGTAQGTDDWDVGPVFEAHYYGEGAYEGLEFHYYLGAQREGPLRVLGWISGGGNLSG